MTSKALRDAAALLGRKGGQIGGKSTSRAKVAAARKNGRRGGWPKGKPRGQKKPIAL